MPSFLSWMGKAKKHGAMLVRKLLGSGAICTKAKIVSCRYLTYTEGKKSIIFYNFSMLYMPVIKILGFY